MMGRVREDAFIAPEDAFIPPRDQLRASELGQMRCPSCGALVADVLGNHRLIVTPDGHLGTAKCDSGEGVALADFGTFRDAMNIAVADDWFMAVGQGGAPAT
jgi:hypothetical protein